MLDVPAAAHLAALNVAGSRQRRRAAQHIGERLADHHSRCQFRQQTTRLTGCQRRHLRQRRQRRCLPARVDINDSDAASSASNTAAGHTADDANQPNTSPATTPGAPRSTTHSTQRHTTNTANRRVPGEPAQPQPVKTSHTGQQASLNSASARRVPSPPDGDACSATVTSTGNARRGLAQECISADSSGSSARTCEPASVSRRGLSQPAQPPP